MPDISVIIFTFNPRPDFMRRVLDAVKVQTMPKDHEELLLIEKPSKKSLAKSCDLSWHPRARHIYEDSPGLTAARLRGIKESTGDLLVFVDDDTVLQPNYISESVRILDERPYLGAVGGQLIPEYEGAPALDEYYYRYYLALREFDHACWSNRWDDFDSSPIGGGMVVRRLIAQAWVERAERQKWRRNLTGGEDIDLVQMACEMGYGKGTFPELSLTHLIPLDRMTPEFLLRIYERNCRDGAYLSAMNNPNFKLPPLRFRHRVKILLAGLALRPLDRKFHFAAERGRWDGWRQAMQDKNNES